MTAAAGLPRVPRATTPAVLLFQSGMPCPSCGAASWLVGRITAECSQCTFPLQLPHPSRRSTS